MKFSEAEWRIMGAVWEKSPITAREVVDSFDGRKKWAYTTVKTMLTRLVEKGALRTGVDGKATTYTPAVSREAARRRALDSFIDRAFDGAFGPMMHFLIEDKRLSAKQRAALLKVLDQEGVAEKPRDRVKRKK
ncbi:MAG: BlaI/MecI/CopY family transcriptional regulator [Phycisphaerae bacterium]